MDTYLAVVQREYVVRVAAAACYGRTPVVVSVDRDPTKARIRVVDQEEGVPVEFVPHAFERFTRATTGVAATQQGKWLRALRRAAARPGERR